MDMSSNITNNMKDHHRISKTRDHSSNSNTTVIKSQTTNPNPKGHSWNYIYNNNNDQDPEDYMINAFSWPPISYTCSFCKREFRSAQALGGHMNVHRKDRARLRQLPVHLRDSSIIHCGRYGSGGTTTTTTFLNLNLNHNPNPRFSTPNLNISATSSSYLLTSKPPLSSLAPTPYSVHNDECPLINIDGADATKISTCGVGSEGQVFGCKSFKKNKKSETRVRLELEIGLFHDHEEEFHRDLDLELRLGYSN